MVASFPGVKYGKLHYRSCDNHKTMVLRDGNGNFQANVTLTSSSQHDLEWWVQHTEHSQNSVQTPTPDITLETDASCTEWGACVCVHPDKQTGESGLPTRLENILTTLNCLRPGLAYNVLLKTRKILYQNSL